METQHGLTLTAAGVRHPVAPGLPVAVQGSKSTTRIFAIRIQRTCWKYSRRVEVGPAPVVGVCADGNQVDLGNAFYQIEMSAVSLHVVHDEGHEYMQARGAK